MFPGLAVAETLLARQHKVKLLVSQRVLEQDILEPLRSCADNHRLGVCAISAVGLTGPRRVLAFGWGLARAVGECAALYREYQPQVVLGMGGYAAAPAIMAARLFRRGRTGTLIHESNAIPGRANRFVRRLVDRVAVGLPNCGDHFRGCRVVVTGTPIRGAVGRGERVADGYEHFGLQPDRATVLVTGGSQGAHAINEALVATLPWMEKLPLSVQFLHLCGADDESMVRESYRANGIPARVLPFCHEMERAYSVADVVIARAGAATLAELAAYGLPSLLIPYPYATGNHQWHNGRVFEQAGAARLYDQRVLERGLHATRGERLAGALLELLGKPALRRQMAEAARGLARHNAAEQIATLVEETARGGEQVARETSNQAQPLDSGRVLGGDVA